MGRKTRPPQTTTPKHPPRDLRLALGAAGPRPNQADAHGVEAAAEIARQQVAWHRRRHQITESHRRRSQLSDPLMVQERHSPTVEIAVDDPEGKRRARRNLTRVRQSEAWRHNQLSTMQREAEAEIALVWKLITAGIGPASSSAFRPRFGIVNAQPLLLAAVSLERTWRAFVPELRRRRIRRDVVIEVLSEPRTLREIERALRLAHGRALTIYERALDCWCELRGWMRPPILINGATIAA